MHMQKTSEILDMPSPLDRLAQMMRVDLDAVETLLFRQTSSEVQTIPNLSNYLIKAGGKRLRPMITLAAAHTCGGGGAVTQKLAAAVEFIHTATLLHDDVVDDSDLRRGKPVAKNVWGSAPSILVGDFLFARAFSLMVETGSLEILGILSNASCIIAEGEVHQLSVQGQLNLPTESYLKIIEAKTAALFEASTRAGAVSANAAPDMVQALSNYGKYLGLAFQITDDALDYGGMTSVIGKSVGDDFREGKITLPIIIARRRGEPADREFLDRALQIDKQEDTDLSHAIHLIRKTGAMEATLEEAKAYIDMAKSALNILPEGQFVDELANLADFCISRAH